MFLLILSICLVALVATTVTRGSQAALALGVALVLCLPSWMYRDLGGLRLDIRQAVCFVLIACALFDPRAKLGGRIVLCDLLVLALALANLASEMLNDELVTATMIVNFLAFWILPYTIGRLVRLDAEGLKQALPPIALGTAILAAFTVVESITRINVIHLITGHGGSLQAAQDIRWGLRRAEGTLTHPIFFGMALVMTLPWTIEAARWARQRLAPAWWRYLPWLTSAGAFFTMSRGPQMSVLGTLAVITWFRNRTWRPIITCVVVVLAGMATVGREQVIELLHAWSGETNHQTIDIHGEIYEYSGTTHRMLQFMVFRDALEHTGWFGYGSLPLMAGRNRLPYVEEHLRQMFSSIDNHYIEYTLRAGFVGLGLFVALALTTLVYLAGPAWRTRGETSVFAATLLGVQLLVTINLAAVWFASDFAFVWLLNVGLASSLHSATLAARSAPTPRSTASVLPRFLSPGHPVWSPGA